VNGNMSVTGNFTVSGGVTFTTSETVLIEDNIITLNSNVTGSPSENAGIEIERGTSANVQLLWNESSDRWTFTNDGSTYYDLPTSVVTSFNGNTGAVTGASLGANTFTGLNSFNAGVSATGLTIGGSEGIEITRRLPAGVLLGEVNFLKGLSAELRVGNISGSEMVFSGRTASVFSPNTSLTIDKGATEGAPTTGDYAAAVRFVTKTGFNAGTATLAPVSGYTTDRTINLPNASGTVALTSQLMGAVNGSTAATTAVTSFNGNTGAVTGASLGANTFTGLNTFTAGLCAAGITVSGDIRFSGTSAKTISSNQATLTIAGVSTSSVLVGSNSVVMGVQVTDSLTLNSATSIVDISTTTSGAYPTIPSIRILTDDADTIGAGSIKIIPASYATANRTQYLQDADGTLALTSQLMGAVNGSTAATTAVTSFNGLTGAVQGVSSAAAGTGISVSAATGAITITNVGVQSFNGNTGAVTGASLGANTFTGLNTFNAGVTTSFLYASTGSTFGSTLQVNGGATFAGRVDVGGVLDVVGGTTFESTTDHAGVARFASGVTISGTLNGATATFSRWLSAPMGISAQTITSRGSSLVLAGFTGGAFSSGSQIVLPVADGIQLNGYGGAVALSSAQAGSVSYNTSLKFMSEDTLNEIYGSVTLTPPSYTEGDYTLYLPNTANGTLALTSQLMGAVNGSTAATTAVTSFNGRTGAVQGVSSAAAGTGISVSAATGAVTITNTGVQSFNGNTGAVTGASLGANTFTGLNTFNAGISAAGGVTFSGTIASDTGYTITSNAINSQTGTTYTFLSSDNGKIVTFNNGSTTTVTIPTGLPVGFNCTAIQLGAGQVGFTAASGVTMNAYASAYKISGQHGAAALVSYTTNIFNLSGTLSA
jgi:ribosomal protein L21E